MLRARARGVRGTSSSPRRGQTSLQTLTPTFEQPKRENEADQNTNGVRRNVVQIERPRLRRSLQHVQRDAEQQQDNADDRMGIAPVQAGEPNHQQEIGARMLE